MGRGAQAPATSLSRPHSRRRHFGALNEILVAAVTRTIRSIPTEVRLDEADGMREPCAVSLDNLVMMPTGHPTERVCTLGPERMAEVCRALDAATEC